MAIVRVGGASRGPWTGGKDPIETEVKVRVGGTFQGAPSRVGRPLKKCKAETPIAPTAVGGGHKKGLDINSRARLGGAFLPYDPPGSGVGAEGG